MDEEEAKEKRKCPKCGSTWVGSAGFGYYVCIDCGAGCWPPGDEELPDG